MAIENEPGTISANTWEILEVLEKVGSPWLGANLDIGHIYVAGEDVAEAVKNLGKRIFYIHVDDIKDGKHYHRVPGTGDVDFQSFVKALEQINYDGFLSVELYTFGLGKLEESDRAAEESIKYLKLI